MVSILVVCFGLTACANGGLLSKQAPEYIQAKILSPIQVPDHLSDQALQNNLLTIPDLPDSVESTHILPAVAANIHPVPAPVSEVEPINIERVRPQHVFADLGNDQYRVMGANYNKYILVNLPYPIAWQKLIDYWRQINSAPNTVKVYKGMIETPWQPITGSLQPSNAFTRGLSAIFGQDDDKAFYKVRISATPHVSQGGLTAALHAVGATPYAPQDGLSSGTVSQYTQVHLAYSEQSLSQREQNASPVWSNTGSVKDQVLFDLLNGLIDMDVPVKLSTLRSTSNNGVPTTLLGKTRAGTPVAYIQSNRQTTLALLLETMQAMAMDVGSYDVSKQKIYFSHTSNINLASSAHNSTSNNRGIWNWFKSLHAKDKNKPQGINITTSDRPQETNLGIIYSAQGMEPSRPAALGDRKGHKVKLGDKVLFVFEDEDQGTFNEQGRYEFTDYYQLQLIPNLNGVYVQVLTAQAQPANQAYAEEILANIVRSIVARS